MAGILLLIPDPLCPSDSLQVSLQVDLGSVLVWNCNVGLKPFWHHNQKLSH